MKGKIPNILRVAIALVLALSLSLVMAVPVSASHDSTATVAFTLDESTMQGEDSSLDVEVTNSSGSLGDINEVVIDFTGTDFLVADGAVTGPDSWTGNASGGIITFTGDTIAPAADAVFVIPVTNPPTVGVATNPTVKTSDTGSQAELEATEDTGWIGYIADAPGTAGNDITIAYADAAPYSALIVSVVGSAISVELADDGTDSTSTATEVADEINSAAGTLITATADSEHLDDLVPVMSATALSGGSIAQVDKPCPVTGILEVTELLLDVTVTPTPATSASLASYVVSFETIVVIAADSGWITITFPAGYDITDVEAGDVSVKVDTLSYTPGAVTAVGQVVTIPAIAEIPAVSTVEVTITGTPEPVKNPPASGDYDIAVATSGLDTGTGEVTITPATFGVVAGADDTVTAGTAFSVAVTALNAEDPAETDIGYIGAHFIDFTSDLGTGTIPAFELITFTAGVGTSPQYFVLTVAGEADVTIIAAEGTLEGESDVITINPATFVKFTISGEPASVVAGVAFTPSIIITAQDADGNTVEDYTGTVSWTSTDESAVLPAAYTFTTGDGEDNGEHTFLGSLFTLKTVGTVDQTITVTDAAAGVSLESATITVTPAAADSIVVSASPGVIEADTTVDSALITATAKDEFGNTDTNYTAAVTFAESLGILSNEDAVFGAVTEGVATATLKSSDVGIATIKVTSGELPYGMTTVKLLPDIGITTIAVTVDKTTILNNGVDVRTITATYKDSADPVKTVTAADGADYTVTFTITTGDATKVTLDPADGVVVPVAGVATVTLTTTVDPGTITVTADGTGAGDGSEDITVTEGTYSVVLAAGWNLISLPLVPPSYTITDVLAELIADETVDQVRTYDQGAWYNWASTGPAGNLTQMQDGAGYWIKMNTAGNLVGTGREIPAPPGGPRSYNVYVGWNMIGFKSLDTTTDVEAYLGSAVTLTLEAIYGYDANAGLYFIPGIGDHLNLEVGYGYWLAVNADGTIYP